MKHYLGKIDTHICNSVINECMQHTVIPYKGNRDLDPTHKYYLDHLEQKQLADKSGYTDGDSVEFFHYKPGHEYSDDIHTIINDTIGAKYCKVLSVKYVKESVRPGIGIFLV